jgi:hypothetical protein
LHLLHGVPDVRNARNGQLEKIDGQQTKMINNLNNVKQKLFKTMERFGSTRSLGEKTPTCVKIKIKVTTNILKYKNCSIYIEIKSIN